MISTRARTIGNVIGYQLVWFACVAGATTGRLWPGLLACAAFAGGTFLLGARRQQDLRALLVVAPLGIALDSGLVALGWLAYATPGPWAGVAPAWIMAIWVAFAMTLNHSLSFLRTRPGVAALFGLLGGPLAYWGAARGFGVITFAEPRGLVLVALGLAWAALLPLALLTDARVAPSLEPSA